MTVAAPAPPPLPAELDAVLRRLRLPYLRKHAPEVLATARAQRWDPAEVLRVLLVEEATGRDAATRSARRRAAGFPSGSGQTRLLDEDPDDSASCIVRTIKGCVTSGSWLAALWGASGVDVRGGTPAGV